jgi:cytochrome c oxidase subunit II
MSEPTAAEQSSQPTLHVDRYEAIWIRVTIIMMVGFLSAVIVANVAYGVQVPGVYKRIKPNEVMAKGSPFADPGLHELAPGKYEAYIRAATWSFTPNEIHVPVGSAVTFYATSLDVQHGFRIMETNINMMILPGQISTLTAHFDKPGTYNLICHEYCGAGGPTIGHHTMYGQIFVEEKPKTQ